MVKRCFVYVLCALYSATGNSIASSQVRAVSPMAQKPILDEAAGVPRKWVERHNEKIAELSERAGEIDLVWIGDSIIEGWEYTGNEVWSEFYQHRNAFNLGFSADTTENVLWRLGHGEIDGVNPKLAIVMIGTNNAGYRKGGIPDKAVDTAAGIAAIVNVLRNILSNTRILLLGIFSRGSTLDDPLGQRNNEVNELITSIGDGKFVYFLDINDSFLEDGGQLREEVMPDLIHPNLEGYRIWAEAIEPTVKILLGDD